MGNIFSWGDENENRNQHLKKVIKERFGLDATVVGDEGGFAPSIENNKDAQRRVEIGKTKWMLLKTSRFSGKLVY